MKYWQEPNITIRMDRGLPGVFLEYWNEERQCMSICEFGSKQEEKIIIKSCDLYLRDWAKKIQSLLSKNTSLFINDEYRETVGDRVIVDKIAKGVPFNNL